MRVLFPLPDFATGQGGRLGIVTDVSKQGLDLVKQIWLTKRAVLAHHRKPGSLQSVWNQLHKFGPNGLAGQTVWVKRKREQHLVTLTKIQ